MKKGRKTGCVAILQQDQGIKELLASITGRPPQQPAEE